MMTPPTKPRIEAGRTRSHRESPCRHSLPEHCEGMSPVTAFQKEMTKRTTLATIRTVPIFRSMALLHARGQGRTVQAASGPGKAPIGSDLASLRLGGSGLA